MVKNKTIGNIFGTVWVLSWFGAIWIKLYGAELFLTGVFALILGALFCAVAADEKKEEKKKLI